MVRRLIVRILRTRRRLRFHERWPRAELAIAQAAALRGLRTFAVARSPFYQRFHRRLENRSLTDLPILGKAPMIIASAHGG
ncbi:MAG: hypothetical protein H0T42_18985 [Deltaproteobacteria bacterium]|nr:hypothetical protein [Deltaproteobacteria bacterium]